MLAASWRPHPTPGQPARPLLWHCELSKVIPVFTSPPATQDREGKLFLCCVTLGYITSLSVPLLPLENGDTNTVHLMRLLWGLQALTLAGGAQQ